MKTLSCVVAGLTLFLAASTLAQVKGSAYVAADAGVNLLLNTDISGADGQAEFNPGYRVDLRLGYLVPNGALFASQQGTSLLDFAAEVDLGFARNSIANPQPNTSAEFSQVPMLFNIMFIGHLSERWSLTVGAGGGASWTMLDFSGSGSDASSNDVGLAYQAFIRSQYRLSDKVSLNLSFSFLSSGDTSLPEGDSQLERTYGFMTGIGATWAF
jgi:hypothetical protein